MIHIANLKKYTVHITPNRPIRKEFSKQILIAVSVGVVAVTVFSCIMVWRTNDLMPLSFLIPAIFTELAVGTGFYYAKARAENEIKLNKLYREEPYSTKEESIL